MRKINLKNRNFFACSNAHAVEHDTGCSFYKQSQSKHRVFCIAFLRRSVGTSINPVLTMCEFSKHHKCEKFGKFLLTILFLIVSACSVISEQQQKIVPANFNIIRKIALDFVPQKCCYSQVERTAFIMEKNSNLIHIYQNGKKINKIGGLGFEKQNFTNLSDIKIAPDNDLLALDSFEKKIKKFDSEGKWITEFEIENTGEPVLFDISIDETFYIYDENRKEIAVTKEFVKNNIFTFGKFQIDEPVQLTKSFNNIIIYDETNDKTMYFENLGQFLKELEGYYQTGKFQDFKLSRFALEHPASGRKFAVSIHPWKFFEIKDNLCLLLSDREMWIAEIWYERR